MKRDVTYVVSTAFVYRTGDHGYSNNRDQNSMPTSPRTQEQEGCNPKVWTAGWGGEGLLALPRLRDADPGRAEKMDPARFATPNANSCGVALIYSTGANKQQPRVTN